MTSKPPLTYHTTDVDGRTPNFLLIGQRLKHNGNGKTYLIHGFCFMGATDEWGFLHSELRDDGVPGVTLARPLNHIMGKRSNGELRYELLER